MEKEVTGLYLTGHPMDEYRGAAKRLGASPIGSIMNDFAGEGGPKSFADNQNITVAGVIQSPKTRTTKNNTLMCNIVLEDDTGTMELLAFQRALDTGGAYMKENTAVLVKGKISVRDEKEPQLMVDSVRPLPEANSQELAALPKAEQKLYVKLPSKEHPVMKRIELVLTMFPGNQQMIVWCEKEQQRFAAKCLIHDALIDELKELLGQENVVLK